MTEQRYHDRRQERIDARKNGVPPYVSPRRNGAPRRPKEKRLARAPLKKVGRPLGPKRLTRADAIKRIVELMRNGYPGVPA